MLSLAGPGTCAFGSLDQQCRDGAGTRARSAGESWARRYHMPETDRYQLCNRVAWAWKLADLGVPGVLVFLGFLNATEMRDQGQLFSTAQL